MATRTLARFFPGGMQAGGANFYFSYDHLGSVREVTDASGNVVGRYDYDPYGRLTINQGVPPRFGFAGLFHHAPSGLDLAEYRAYDPDLGRWESRDPLGIAGGLNLYGYVTNDPVSLVDPWGEQPRTPAGDGPPNTWVWFPPSPDKPEGGQWRLYGPDGKAVLDNDYDPGHENSHLWDWTKQRPRLRGVTDPDMKLRPEDPSKPTQEPLKYCPYEPSAPPDSPGLLQRVPRPPVWLAPVLGGGLVIGCIFCPECCLLGAAATL